LYELYLDVLCWCFLKTQPVICAAKRATAQRCPQCHASCLALNHQQTPYVLLTLLQMLRQGRDVNCCDYDGRTGLMLAASKGHGLAVSLLLRSGAQPNAEDLAGSNALLEAAKGGHDETLQ
jgi:hypothetical protein